MLFRPRRSSSTTFSNLQQWGWASRHGWSRSWSLLRSKASPSAILLMTMRIIFFHLFRSKLFFRRYRTFTRRRRMACPSSVCLESINVSWVFTKRASHLNILLRSLLYSQANIVILLSHIVSQGRERIRFTFRFGKVSKKVSNRH